MFNKNLKFTQVLKMFKFQICSNSKRKTHQNDQTWKANQRKQSKRKEKPHRTELVIPIARLMGHDPITTPRGRDHIAHTCGRQIGFAWSRTFNTITLLVHAR
jgi:hypothetical protein